MNAILNVLAIIRKRMTESPYMPSDYFILHFIGNLVGEYGILVH